LSVSGYTWAQLDFESRLLFLYIQRYTASQDIFGGIIGLHFDVSFFYIYGNLLLLRIYLRGLYSQIGYPRGDKIDAKMPLNKQFGGMAVDNLLTQ